MSASDNQDLFMRMPPFDQEEHRHQCELRWLASLVLPERRKYLELAEKMRGSKARKRLEEGLIELWQKR